MKLMKLPFLSYGMGKRETSGKYTGTFVDGKPEGEGHWRTESDEMTYDYWGSFTNGRFNGNGRAVITADGESMT